MVSPWEPQVFWVCWFLADQGLTSSPVVPVATRSGLRETTLLPDGRVRVAMGPVAVTDAGVLVTAAGGEPAPALTVDVGNPHAVIFVADLDHLALAPMPRWEPENAFPQGVNLEFVRWLGPRHLRLRVHERGVGETRSCGTGACAAMAAAARRAGVGGATSYVVDVPGGRLTVSRRSDGQVELTGPAVLVAEGALLPEWLASHR